MERPTIAFKLEENLVVYPFEQPTFADEKQT